MSDNLPTNVQLEANASGTVSFAPEVIATIAGVAATEVEGVASMYGGNSGFADMFSRKNQSAKAITRGVRVEFSESSVNVFLTIIVDYGSPIPEVSLNIQENVKKAIETMSGLTVASVNVHVQSLSFERENKKAIEMQDRQRLNAEKAKTEAEAEAEENAGEFWPEDAEKPEAEADDVSAQSEDMPENDVPEAGVEDAVCETCDACESCETCDDCEACEADADAPEADAESETSEKTDA